MDRAEFNLKIEKIKHIGQLTKSEIPTAILTLAGFFMGRVALFQYMNPVVLAYLGCFSGKNKRLYIISLFCALGVITKFEGIFLFKYLSAIFLICGANGIFSIGKIKVSPDFSLGISAVAAAFAGLLYGFIYGISGYYVVMAAIESAFVAALGVLIKKGVHIISSISAEKEADNESLISFAVIAGAVVAGAADIYIGQICIKYMLCAYLVMIAAYKAGPSVGAMCGVVLGFILTLVGYLDYSLVGILSIAGVAGGIFRQGGKLSCLAGFLAGAVLSSIYIDYLLLNKESFYSVLIACGLYFATPENFTVKINSFMFSKGVDEAKQAKLSAVRKLESLSETFEHMGAALENLAEKKPALSQKDISRLIDDAANKACSLCENRSRCWEINFFRSFQMSFALLEICEEKGVLYPKDIPDEYDDYCLYIGHYGSWLSRLYDMYKLNLNWQNSIAESRSLVSGQLMGVAKIVENIAGELNKQEKFKADLEMKVYEALDKKNISAENIIISETEEGRYLLSLERTDCSGKRNCIKEMAAIISSAIGRNMVCEEKNCGNVVGRKKCTMAFTEEPKFRLVSSASMQTKSGSFYSGDSHSVLQINGCEAVLALSDGMGSGKRARAESEAALDILEYFLEAGFSKEIALKMINSVLVLKSNQDSFSTMDICAIDLHTGLAEFVKIGAATTFIKRGSKVNQIISSSLPLGILNEVDTEISKRRLKDGDLIIMVTDGVSDAKESYLGESWITAELSEFDGSNPKDVADFLLKRAEKHSGGEIKDDMTVLCARIWEKIS